MRFVSSTVVFPEFLFEGKLARYDYNKDKFTKLVERDRFPVSGRPKPSQFLSKYINGFLLALYRNRYGLNGLCHVIELGESVQKLCTGKRFEVRRA